jgi:hypothetical protein
MGALQKTLFIIAFLGLLPQTIRHLYVRWAEPSTSVLDKYETPVKEGIKKASSLDELVKQYDEARKKTPEAEGSTVDSRVILAETSNVLLLQGAIQEWEGRTKEIFELRFFWGCGFVLLLMGIFCYGQTYLWLGLSLITAGITEMIWWTSPSFRWAGGSKEFDKLLTNKIIFSIASIILLLATAYFVDRLNTLKVKV